MTPDFERSLHRWLGMPLFSIDRRKRQTPPGMGIDLGNGKQLGPEDVLESHFQRLARTRTAPPASRAPRTPVTVPVQVGDNLITAITVLAPGLVPLTALAEDVACALPPVQPGSEFRASLHQALEQTHRQHTAHRILGTRPHPRSQAGLPLWARIIFLLAMLITVRLVVMRLFGPHRDLPSPPDIRQAEPPPA